MSSPGSSSRQNPQFMAGVPELVVLRLLSSREMYGYELAAAVQVSTGEALKLGESVLYPLLHSLNERGEVRAKKREVDGRTRVYYAITPKGKTKLARLTHEWSRIAKGVQLILDKPQS
jgi:PadR family transcriptional regulator, regulatory protein PadR